MDTVRGQIGVIGGDCRDAQLLRGKTRRRTQNHQTGEMDQIGAELPECRHDARLRRRKADVGVEWEWNTTQRNDLCASVVLRSALRREQQCFVSFVLHVLQQAAQRRDNAVDIGQKGLGDQCYPHPSAPL